MRAEVIHMDLGELLHFESQWPVMSGAKETAIREKFGVNPARYYQMLNGVLASADAVKADPMTVRRLLRARDRRVQARAGRRFELNQ